MHARRHLVALHGRDVAVGVVEVAEVEGLADARKHARRRHRAIDAGNQVGAPGLVDPLDAEGALGGDAEALVLVMDLLDRRLAALEVADLVGDQEARLIGAGDVTVHAADAQVVALEDDAVLALAGRRRRADLHARRLRAVHAADRHEDALDARIFADLEIAYAPPLHRRRRHVGMLAGHRAGVAPDALLDIYDHAPPLGGIPSRFDSHDAAAFFIWLGGWTPARYRRSTRWSR